MPISSYNFGITGLCSQEIDYSLDSILAKAGKGQLRYAIIELNYPRQNFPPMFAGTYREVFWHDFRRTCDTSQVLSSSILRAAKTQNLADFTTRLGWLGKHWSLHLQREAHLGKARRGLSVHMG